MKRLETLRQRVLLWLAFGAVLQVSVQSAKIHSSSAPTKELVNISLARDAAEDVGTRIFQVRAMGYSGDSEYGVGMVGEIAFTASAHGAKFKCTCTTMTEACNYDRPECAGTHNRIENVCNANTDVYTYVRKPTLHHHVEFTCENVPNDVKKVFVLVTSGLEASSSEEVKHRVVTDWKVRDESMDVWASIKPDIMDVFASCPPCGTFAYGCGRPPSDCPACDVCQTGKKLDTAGCEKGDVGLCVPDGSIAHELDVAVPGHAYHQPVTGVDSLVSERTFELRAMDYAWDSRMGYGMVGSVELRVSVPGIDQMELHCTCTTLTSPVGVDNHQQAVCDPWSGNRLYYTYRRDAELPFHFKFTCTDVPVSATDIDIYIHDGLDPEHWNDASEPDEQVARHVILWKVRDASMGVWTLIRPRKRELFSSCPYCANHVFGCDWDAPVGCAPCTACATGKFMKNHGCAGTDADPGTCADHDTGGEAEVCTSMVCPAGYTDKKDKGTRFCKSTTCTDMTDLLRCCDPNTCGTHATCSKGYVVDPAKNSLGCAECSDRWCCLRTCAAMEKCESDLMEKDHSSDNDVCSLGTCSDANCCKPKPGTIVAR
mmetsp:Transcript_60978/g.108378  ORF Transcript_60978/g.108378 Transcript_60978/m.108378 type:complete len:598 (+) Transcript_60978:76-1869(+)